MKSRNPVGSRNMKISHGEEMVKSEEASAASRQRRIGESRNRRQLSWRESSSESWL